MKTIKQTVMFRGVTPARVYATLTDSRRHAAVTGAKAKIGARPGEPWSAYDGGLSGTQVELVPGKRIVQTWRASDWPKDHYSVATFAIAKVRGGARLTFHQDGVPDRRAGSISDGWHEFYWHPMRAALERPRARGAARRA